MKVEKRSRKRPANKDKEPAIYIHSCGMGINAEARDFLKVPEFISVEFEENKIILSQGTKEDYKVTYTKHCVQRISASMFQSGFLAKIPNKTKIFGICKNGKLVFEIPEEYINR